MLKLHKVLDNAVVTDFFLSLNNEPKTAKEIVLSGYVASKSEIAHLESAFKCGDVLYRKMQNTIEDLQYINLRDIVDNKLDISEEARENLVIKLCYRCRTAKWNRIRSIITYDLSNIDSKSILERMLLNLQSNEWFYTAAQSHSEEIAYIRDYVIYSK